MEISRDNQQILADIVLRVLARGLCAVSMFDKRVAEDVKALGDGFSFAICAGLGENSPCVRLKSENGRFVRADTDPQASVIIIRFKDVSGIIPVLLGKTSVAAAFAQHRMLVWGSINQAVTLVRIIDITEAYLFPKFIIKKAMLRVPKKQVPGLLVYIMMLFFGLKKPERIHEAEDSADNGDREDVFAVEPKPLDEENEATEELEAAK